MSRNRWRQPALWIITVLVAALSLGSSQATAQTQEWVWVGGSSTHGQLGIYGQLGVASANNVPGARESACSWLDQNGDFWLYGGYGRVTDTNVYDILDDLWKFDPSTLEWTWTGGHNTGGATPPVYGTKGVSASGNTPGARREVSCWADDAGKFWLFGGDLWEYDPSTGEWTWVSGGDVENPGTAGVYGVKGTPAQGNSPGTRRDSAAWVDNAGNFWLFGGYGRDSTATEGGGYLNDLWEFNPKTLEWTWISGSDVVSPNAAFDFGVYGTLEKPAAGNTPGGRRSAQTWKDANGNLWLLGGFATDDDDNEYVLNDLWEFNTKTLEWTWMGGSDQLSTEASAVGDLGWPGVYGTQGTANAANLPGSRYFGSPWVDSNGNLWEFGGIAFDSNGNEGGLNDLWELNPTTTEWTWVGGTSAIPPGLSYYGTGPQGVYGTMGVPAPKNIPGGRSMALSWTDQTGLFWLFGGDGQDSGSTAGEPYPLNDLWIYGTVANAPTFDPPAGTYNGVQQVTISDTATSATIYYTTDGTAPTASSPKYAGPVTLNQTTDTLQAFVVAPGLLRSEAASAAYALNLPPAAQPVILPGTGTYSSVQQVAITDATQGATIYYTTNGQTPTTGSIPYTGPITVSTSETVQAIATATGYIASPVASAAFSLVTATPVLTPGTGQYTAPQPVAISDATPGAAIYYTLDGTAPSIASTKYTAPIKLTETRTVKAFATANGFNDSQVSTGVYSFPRVTPVITWNEPRAITYGAPLSATELDAKASVVGTFKYSPDTGTVLRAGTHTLSVTFTPSDSIGYTPVTRTIELTVAKRALIVAAGNASRVYGARMPTLGYTITGFVNGDIAAKATTGKPELKPAADHSSPVGTYAITVTRGTLSSANYTFDTKDGTLTIKPAPLTVKADNKSMVEDAMVPTLTYSFVGFVNNDTQAKAVSGKAALTTRATSNSKPGPYAIDISAGTLAAKNYRFTFEDGTLTVTKD